MSTKAMPIVLKPRINSILEVKKNKIKKICRSCRHVNCILGPIISKRV